MKEAIRNVYFCRHCVARPVALPRELCGSCRASGLDRRKAGSGFGQFARGVALVVGVVWAFVMRYR